MAEAIGLAASIVGIASAGVSVVSTLTKFGISFRGSNEKINSLASRVSLTASILSDIATTVAQNASGFKKEEFWMTWRKVLLSCEESYGKLDRALLKARRSGASKGENGNDEVSVWGKLVWALGGEMEMQVLETSLERCGQQVMMMQQAVQMSVLSLIAQRQKLSSEEIEDQRELMGKLQWLLSTLSEAGILPAGNTKGKPVIVIDESTPDPLRNPEPANLPITDRSRGINFADIEEPPTRNKSFGLQGPPAKDRPKSVDFAESHAPPTRSKPFGSSGSGIRLTSAVKPILPPLGHRSQRVPSTSMAPKPEPREQESTQEIEYFFEAYYIIPRSVPRAQPRGQIQLTKPAPDDYMIIYLDTTQDYQKDPNLRNALRRAKQARHSAATSAVDEFPKTVREAALSLASHRRRHANGLAWALVEGIELRCLEESIFRKSSLKSGFLIVFRGNREPPRPPSILKRSANNIQNGEAPPHSAGHYGIPMVGRNETVIRHANGDETSDNGTRTTYKVAADPPARASSMKESSRARRSTLDSNTNRPPVVIAMPAIYRSSSRSREGETYAVPATSGAVNHHLKRYSANIDNEGLRKLAKETKYHPTSPESENAGAPPASVSRTSKNKLEESKIKAKVEFQNPELLKGERPVTRPIPGPVLYDPARSKLLPDSPPVGATHDRRATWHSGYTSLPSPSGQPHAIPQRPYHQSPTPSLVSAYSPYNTSPTYAMRPAPPLPGWTASPQYSRPASSDSGIPKPAIPPGHTYRSPTVVIDNFRHSTPSRRRSEASRSYIEHDRQGPERIILRRRRSSPPPFTDSAPSRKLESSEDERDEEDNRLAKRITTADVAEIYMERKRREAEEQTSEREYRRRSTRYYQHGERRERIESVEERRDEDIRRRPALPVIINSISGRKLRSRPVVTYQDALGGENYTLTGVLNRNNESQLSDSSLAKAGATTAAVAGVVGHARNKSQTRSEERSRSRIRTGPEIVSAGLAGAAVSRLYENNKEKKDRDSRGVPALGTGQYASKPIYIERTTSWSEDSEEHIVERERGVPSQRRHGSDSERSDSPGTGDEESTLVEEWKEEKEELHLTQSEAQAMMMNFLKTFTTV